MYVHAGVYFLAKLKICLFHCAFYYTQENGLELYSAQVFRITLRWVCFQSLCRYISTECVIFVSGVDGVYTKPPGEDGKL